MKRSKMILFPLIVVLCLTMAGVALAQLPGGMQLPGGSSIPGLGNIQSLTQAVNLSPAQLTKIQPILQSEASKITGIKNNKKLSGEDKVKQAESLRAQTDTQVKPILDASQFKQWQSFRQNEFGDLSKSLLR
jgi:hypothetical protein